MSKHLVRVSCAALLMFGLTASVAASPPRINDAPFGLRIEPLELAEKAGPVELLVKFGKPPGPGPYGDSIEVAIKTQGPLIVGGETRFALELREPFEYTRTIVVTVPAGDPATPVAYVFAVELSCGEVTYSDAVTFMVLGEEVKYIPGTTGEPPEDYFPQLRKPPAKDRVDLYWEQYGLTKKDFAKRGLLTPEQLRIVHKIVLDLRDPDRRKIAEEVLGPLPDSAEIKSVKGVYLLDIMLENTLKLEDSGIEVGTPYELPKRLRDSLKIRVPGEDSLMQKSSLEASPSGFSLDYVDGEGAPGVLLTGQTITFHLRMNNYFGVQLAGMTNGFRVYSPDGAQWGATVGDTVNLGWRDMFDMGYLIRNHSADGVGADTVGFTGVAEPPGGLPIYFDEDALTITIGPINPTYAGRTICLDTSFFHYGGYWAWVDGSNNTYRPWWHGPYTFTIANPEIEFSGYARYWDMNPEVNGPVPIRNARIEMWDLDAIPYMDDLLDYYTTGQDGYFHFGPFDNDDLFGEDQLDVYFCIWPSNEAAFVTVDPMEDEYYIQTAVANELPSGVYDTVFQMANNIDSSGPFYIADVVLEGYDEWTSVEGEAPYRVKAVHRSTGITGYSNYINIQKSVNSAEGYPDTFDGDIILHEYGHYLEDYFGFLDDGLLVGGEHAWEEPLASITAGCEGGADFISSLLTTSPWMENRFSNFSATSYWNLEDGTYGRVGYAPTGTANSIDGSEAQVACMLWDIYDQPNDDYSACPGSSAPDGRMDSAWMSTNPILSALLYKQAVDGFPPDDITEFKEAWIEYPHNSRLRALEDIYYEHGISCCVGKRGDVNGLGGDTPSIGDAAALISYIFSIGGYQELPGCFEEANVVSDNPLLTVSDALLIIDCIFISGEPLPDCPCVP